MIFSYHPLRPPQQPSAKQFSDDKSAIPLQTILVLPLIRRLSLASWARSFQPMSLAALQIVRSRCIAR
jgi:hypothetical protein